MHLPKQLGLLLGDPAPGAWQQKLLYSSHVSVATWSVTTVIGCFLDAWLQRHAAPSVMFQKIKVVFFSSFKHHFVFEASHDPSLASALRTNSG